MKSYHIIFFILLFFMLTQCESPNVAKIRNEGIIFRFAVYQGSYVKLVIENVIGDKVRTLVSEYLEAGVYKVTWYGRNDDGERR